jgi:hypothetical protein
MFAGAVGDSEKYATQLLEDFQRNVPKLNILGVILENP